MISAGFTGTSSGSSNITCYGNVSLGGTYSNNAIFVITQGRSAQTWTSNGVSTPWGVQVQNIGGSLTLQDNLTITNRYLTVVYGTLNTNGKTYTGSSFTFNNSNTKTINLGASVLNITGTGTPFNAGATGTTFNAGTSTINITGNGATTFAGAGLAYNNITLSGGSSQVVTVTGANTFNNMTVSGQCTLTLPASITTTISSLTDNSAGAGVTLNSSTGGTAGTLSCASGTVSVFGWTIQDNAATGGATFQYDGSSTILSDVTGWSLMILGYSLGQSLYFGDETLYLGQYAYAKNVQTDQLNASSKITKSRIKAIYNIVQTNIIRFNKQKQSNLKAINIQSTKFRKSLNKNIKTIATNTIKVIKQKTTNIKFTLVNTANIRKTKNTNIKVNKINSNRINKQKQSNFKAVGIQSTKFNKVKNTILRGIQVTSTTLKKSVSKSSRAIYTQKAGEIGETLYRLITVAAIWGIKKSKSVSKGIKTNLVQNVHTNKSKSSKIQFTQIRISSLFRFKLALINIVNVLVANIKKKKTTNVHILRIQNLSIKKIKSTIIRSIKILGSKFTKTKSSHIKSTQIQISRTTKFKNTIIKAISILTLRNKKQKNTKIRSTQIVSATVTKATHRRRGSTANITYTIANTRRQTLYRKFKATAVNTLSINKGINKKAKVSNTNVSLISKEHIFWEFLVQLVTKITPFNRQTIQKPNYGRPDPDNWDPNMVDTSTPGVEGLVDNGLVEDNFND